MLERTRQLIHTRLDAKGQSSGGARRSKLPNTANIPQTYTWKQLCHTDPSDTHGKRSGAVGGDTPRLSDVTSLALHPPGSLVPHQANWTSCRSSSPSPHIHPGPPLRATREDPASRLTRCKLGRKRGRRVHRLLHEPVGLALVVGRRVLGLRAVAHGLGRRAQRRVVVLAGL